MWSGFYAATASGTANGDRVAVLDAGTDATPAPDASANPGEGSGGSGSGWITSTPTPADSLVPIMLGATWAHVDNGWLFSAPKGGWEYPAFWTVTLVVQALLGEGAFALRLGAARRPALQAA